MKERMKVTGSTPKESKINDARRLLRNDFYNDTAYTEFVYFWIPGQNPHKGNHLDIKFYDRKYSASNGNTKSFQTKDSDQVEVGDYIFDESDNTYWICTESFNIDSIHYKGKFTQCNWFLKWQRTDGAIVEYPCQDLNSTQYNSGESGTPTIKLGSAQHMETVQATEDTLSIESPLRFFVSRTNSIPFVVTQNDTTTYNYGKGLCKITLTQDTKSDMDRPDLGICDYISPIIPESINGATVLSLISGNYDLRVGFSKPYTVIFTDINGNELSGVNFSWNIVCDFASDIIQVINGNEIALRVDKNELIGNSFLLQVLIGGVVNSDFKVNIIGLA